MKQHNKVLGSEQKRRWTCMTGLTLALVLGGALLIAAVINLDSNFTSRLCPSVTTATTNAVTTSGDAVNKLRAILHYATSKVVPQQSKAEITVTLDVITSEFNGVDKGFNFLVFGLGHDSVMWESFNSAPTGKTLFLEEDPKWLQTVLKDNPNLRAHHVNYRTQLQQSNELISTYRAEKRCEAEKAWPLKGNTECRLALENLPREVYETEWDLIMIDAPRGYFPEAPGRMAAIFSAAVMARHRRSRPGPTHVFLHDVDRPVEKLFAEEFLCRKYLVKAVGRLWHFRIPSGRDIGSRASNHSFCYNSV